MPTKVKNNVFVNNRLSFVIRSSNSISSLVYCNTILAPKAAAVLYENLTSPDSASSFEPTKSAFMQAAKSEGIDGVFYDWLKSHVRSHLSQKFIKLKKMCSQSSERSVPIYEKSPSQMAHTHPSFSHSARP